jgi:hypothetical protein
MQMTGVCIYTGGGKVSQYVALLLQRKLLTWITVGTPQKFPKRQLRIPSERAQARERVKCSRNIGGGCASCPSSAEGPGFTSLDCSRPDVLWVTGHRRSDLVNSPILAV